MADESSWAREDSAEVLKRRRLATEVPPMVRFFSEGDRVLDVGCGPGTITLGVAEAVAPGSAVGVDSEPKQIERARQALAESGLDNVEFQVGDAYSLEFPDAEFDVTYGHGLLEYVPDPVRAVKEQIRVTKKGGWIINGGLLPRVRYPVCPAVDEARNALATLANPDDPEHFINLEHGERLIATFLEAGVRSVSAEPYMFTGSFKHAGSEDWGDDEGRSDLQILDPNGVFGAKWRYLMDTGALPRDYYADVQQDIEAYRTHPHAFHFSPRIFAAGKVE